MHDGRNTPSTNTNSRPNNSKSLGYDYIDVMLHPVERNSWKSLAVGAIGRLFGFDVRAVHCSLKISLSLYDDEQQPQHVVIHDFTDEGVQSTSEITRPVLGYVRLYLDPELDVKYIDEVLERISDSHDRGDKLNWFEGWNVVRRGETKTLVCTNWVLSMLGMGDEYMTPLTLADHVYRFANRAIPSCVGAYKSASLKERPL